MANIEDPQPFQITYKQFADAYREFTEALTNLNRDEAGNGMKCLGILYVNLRTDLDACAKVNCRYLFEKAIEVKTDHEVSMIKGDKHGKHTK